MIVFKSRPPIRGVENSLNCAGHVREAITHQEEPANDYIKLISNQPISFNLICYLIKPFHMLHKLHDDVLL